MRMRTPNDFENWFMGLFIHEEEVNVLLREDHNQQNEVRNVLQAQQDLGDDVLQAQ